MGAALSASQATCQMPRAHATSAAAPPPARAAVLSSAAMLSSLHPNIFRTVAMRDVLDHGFSRRTQPAAAPATHPSKPLAEPLLPHTAADAVFFAAEESNSVEAYISTSAASSRLRNVLALRHAVNVPAAVVASLLAFGGGLGALVLWQRLGTGAHLLGLAETEVPRGAVIYAALLFPSVVFLATLMLGHGLPGRAQERAWIASLCLHQSRTNLCARAIAALPEFVAGSDRLVACLDRHYFASLPALMEIAHFCAARGRDAAAKETAAAGDTAAAAVEATAVAGGSPARKFPTSSEASESGELRPSARRSPPPNADYVDFLPLHTAPWLMINQALEAAACVASSSLLLPLTRAHVGDHVLALLGEKAPLAEALSQAAALGAAALLARTPLIIYNAISLTRRLEEHEATLAALAQPAPLATARCDDPALRLALLRHMGALAIDESGSDAAGDTGSFAGSCAGSVASTPTKLLLPPTKPGVIAEDGVIADLDATASPADFVPIADDELLADELTDALAEAEMLLPWMRSELAPRLVRRLGRAGDIPLPLALLAVLPALYHSAIVAFDCHGQPCSAHVAAAKAGARTSDDLIAVRAAGVPLALLSSPLSPALALALISGCRRVLHCCCCSNGACDRILALPAATLAYAVGAAAAALPPALLMPACFPRDSADLDASTGLAALVSCLATILALYSLLFASTQPRSVLALALLALGVFGAAVLFSVHAAHEGA